jgi:hypothetical protein
MLVLVTVDVEGAHSLNPVESMIYGQIGNEELGIAGIMDLCDQFHVKASFFVDVYEHSLHGTDVMKQVTANIVDREHDVQLHTHPGWPIDNRDQPEIQAWKQNNCIYDPERPWMYQYSLDEQVEILRDGKKLLDRWCGRSIIAHRAGGYGANKNTLEAAKTVGLKMDFSAFRGHENCRLKAKANTIQTIRGVVEVPVTGFYRPGFLRFPRLPFKRRFVKTDIDWAFLDELKFFYQNGEKNGLKVMVLFMHSYSFVKHSPTFDNFEQNHREIVRFKEFVHWALESGASFVTVSDFWSLFQANPQKFQNRDYLPTFNRAGNNFV